MRQNSFSASEQIETSFLDFLESPGASRAEKVVKFCHHEGEYAENDGARGAMSCSGN